MTVRACLSLRCMRARVCAGSCSDSDENEDDIDQGDSRSSRSLQGGKRPQHSGEQPPEKKGAVTMMTELVEAGPRVLTPERSPSWEGVGPVVLRALWGVSFVV